MTSMEHLAPAVKAWLKRTADTPYGVEKGVSRVMARLPQTRQRSRWWPLPSLQRAAPPGRGIPGKAFQPTPLQATSGHTPTVTARFPSVSGATRFAAAAAIVALFGGFLLAGVSTTQLEETGPAAGATTTPESSTVQPIALPAEIPAGVESGTVDTPLGPARWVHLRGDDTTLPDLGGVVPVSTGGYITVDGEGPSPRLWRSPDLITWAPELLPMAVEARYASLALADDAVWLKTNEPTALWRSEDSVTWAEVSLEELAPLAPLGPWLLDLGEPLTFDGITVVPFSALPDHLLVHRAMGGTIDDRVRAFCCRRGETGAYELYNDKGERFAIVRFEDTDGGLRVIDAGDGTELAFLDGVEPTFIELLAASDFRPDAPGLAMLDDGGLVPAGGSWWTADGDQRSGRWSPPDPVGERSPVFSSLPGVRRVPADVVDRAFDVDFAGFVAYSLGRDGLVHIGRSRDGRRWIETDIVGDDPGEPTDIEGVDSWQGSLSIGQHDNTTWTPAADGSWTSHREEPFGIRFADGSLLVHHDEFGIGEEGDRDGLKYRTGGGDLVLIDPADDLGIVAQMRGCCGASFMALSGNTVVLSFFGDERRHRRHHWIITFDELTR